MSDNKFYRCKHCSIPFPDDATVAANCRSNSTKTFPVCWKAPDESRWLIDSGMNGHMFVEATAVWS